MLEFIEGDQLIEQFQCLMEGSATAHLAVAFWGAGSASLLKKGSRTRIICNLQSGACNPDEIKKLRGLVNMNIKTHKKLHAKVYCTEKGAIIGSSNASTNGLAILASDVPGWFEANIIVDDRKILVAITEWFNRMWEDAQTIKDSDLVQAEKLWKKRRHIAPDRQKAKNLIAALKSDAELFESTEIYCIVYRDDLDPGADKKWKKLPISRIPQGPWPYQPVKSFVAGSWLISCYFEDQKNWGIDNRYLQVPDPVLTWPSEIKKERPLYAAHPKTAIDVGPVPYRLSRKEKADLLKKLQEARHFERLKKAWETGDAVIPLHDLIG